MLCAAIKEDPEGSIHKDMRLVLEKLLDCLSGVESYVKTYSRDFEHTDKHQLEQAKHIVLGMRMILFPIS